jgi:hypothetical protein
MEYIWFKLSIKGKVFLKAHVLYKLQTNITTINKWCIFNNILHVKFNQNCTLKTERCLKYIYGVIRIYIHPFNEDERPYINSFSLFLLAIISLVVASVN